MHRRLRIALAQALVAVPLFASPAARAAEAPAEAVAATLRALLGAESFGDWTDLEKLPAIRWAPLPPNMLENCLPDGGCFTRLGIATLGNLRMNTIATGARTMVGFLYLRNTAAPIGEGALLAALRAAGMEPELARCPISAASGGGTNWYRLSGEGIHPGVIAIQSRCDGKPCEGITLSQGPDLPALQPKQLSMYTEACDAPAGERAPITTVSPQDELVRNLIALLPPRSGPYDWATLRTRAPSIAFAGEPTKADSSFRNDPNPLLLSGTWSYPGRAFGVSASGDAAQPRWIFLEEMGLHPAGEDVLGALRARGLTVELVRCGPLYTESTLNWYAVKGPDTGTATLEVSNRREGPRVQDAYVLRIDGSLPTRDPRDLDPGVGRCAR